MQIAQLKYFQAVCLLGSTVRASEALYVSQPSISSAISKLEQEFGVVLFNRDKNRMILTEDGAFFLNRVNEILADYDKLEKEMHQLGNPNELNVSIPPVEYVVLPKIINQFTASHPDFKLRLYEDLQSEVEPLLFANQRDIAITVTDNLDTNLYDVTHLMTAHLRFYARNDSKFAQLNKISVTDIANTPIILFKDSFNGCSALLERFEQYDITPNIYMFSSQLSTVRSTIKAGFACGCMIGEWSNLEGVISLPLDPPIVYNIGIVRKKSEGIQHNLHTFAKYLESSFSEIKP